MLSRKLVLTSADWSKKIETRSKPCLVSIETETQPVFISDGSGMEKVGFGRVRVYPNFQMSGSGMSGIEKSWVLAGIFGFGYTWTHQ